MNNEYEPPQRHSDLIRSLRRATSLDLELDQLYQQRLAKAHAQIAASGKQIEEDYTNSASSQK